MNLPIAIIISLFGLCVTMPLFVRYFAYAPIPLWAKLIGLLFCITIATLPIFTSRDFASIYGNFFAVFERISTPLFLLSEKYFAICENNFVYLFL